MRIDITNTVVGYMVDSLRWKQGCEWEILRGNDRRETQRDIQKSHARFKERVLKMIRGEDTSLRAFFISNLQGKDYCQLSPIMADLIIHQGMDPVPLCMFNMLVQDDRDTGISISTEICEESLVLRRSKEDIIKDQTSYIMLSDNVAYSEGPSKKAFINVINFPESTLIAMTGKKLSEVFSHPVLDRHDLDIIDTKNGVVQKIEVSGNWDYLTIDEVARLTPVPA